MDLSKLKQQEAASLNTRRPHQGGLISGGALQRQSSKGSKHVCYLWETGCKIYHLLIKKNSPGNTLNGQKTAFWTRLRLNAWTRSFTANTSRNLNGTPGKGRLRLLQVLKESAWTLKPAKSLKNKQTGKYEDFQLSQRTIRTNRDESETSQKTNGLMDVNNSPINATGGKKK